MTKLVALLNEDTIINFKMLARLCSRYRQHMFFAFGFFVAITLFNFYSKPVIFSISIPMKAAVVHQVSRDLSSLLPVENEGKVTLEELQITLSHHAFLKSIAESVYSHLDFKKFTLGNLKTNRTYNEKEFKEICAERRSCIVEKITAVIGSHFFIEAGATENRFLLMVNARDKMTATYLTEILRKAIEGDRVRISKYLVLKEISSVENLLAESRSMINNMGGNEALEEQSRLQNDITDLKDRIRMLQQDIRNETIVETTLMAQLSENSKSIQFVDESNSRSDSKAAHSRIVETKANLLALSQTPEARWTKSDKAIVAQLKNEMENLAKKFPSELKLRTLENKEVFSEKLRDGMGSLKFDYQVSLHKRSKLEEEYKTSNEELNLLMHKKLSHESRVDGMQSEMNFTKTLEAKLMSLKLVSATLNPDIMFEDGNLHADEFRDSSPIFIMLMSLGIALLVYLFSIITRYALDDRIYGEDDLRACFKDLSFVGDVPFFGKT